MKIIEQLTDNTFVVELKEPQFKKEHRVLVAHNYVMFFHTAPLSTDCEKFKQPGLRGPLAVCNNMLLYDSSIQISIKVFSEAILPMLNRHDYCQPDHYNQYWHYEHIVTFFENGKKMVTFFDNEEGIITLPHSVYVKLTNNKS